MLTFFYIDNMEIKCYPKKTDDKVQKSSNSALPDDVQD